MDRMLVLIVVVIAGFLACWSSLQTIEEYLRLCLLALNSMEAKTGTIETMSDTLNSVEQLLQERFSV